MAIKGEKYLDLVRHFPLRPIRSERDLDRAAKVIDSLVDRPSLSFDEKDYLNVLSDLVEAYEEEHYPIASVGPFWHPILDGGQRRQSNRGSSSNRHCQFNNFGCAQRRAPPDARAYWPAGYFLPRGPRGLRVRRTRKATEETCPENRVAFPDCGLTLSPLSSIGRLAVVVGPPPMDSMAGNGAISDGGWRPDVPTVVCGARLQEAVQLGDGRVRPRRLPLHP